MTYELFEYEVITRLLELARAQGLNSQVWHLIPSDRFETKAGFVTKFSAPDALTMPGIDYEIKGLSALIPNIGSVDLTLEIKHGQIASVKGSFFGDLSYQTLLSDYEHVTFYETPTHIKAAKPSSLHNDALDQEKVALEIIDENIPNVTSTNNDTLTLDELTKTQMNEDENFQSQMTGIKLTPSVDAVELPNATAEKKSNLNITTLGELLEEELKAKKAFLVQPLKEIIDEKDQRKSNRVLESLQSINVEALKTQELNLIKKQKRRKQFFNLLTFAIIISFLAAVYFGIITFYFPFLDALFN